MYIGALRSEANTSFRKGRRVFDSVLCAELKRTENFVFYVRFWHLANLDEIGP